MGLHRSYTIGSRRPLEPTSAPTQSQRNQVAAGEEGGRNTIVALAVVHWQNRVHADRCLRAGGGPRNGRVDRDLQHWRFYRLRCRQGALLVLAVRWQLKLLACVAKNVSKNDVNCNLFWQMCFMNRPKTCVRCCMFHPSPRCFSQCGLSCCPNS